MLDVMAADDDFFVLASFDDLSDVLPNILGFLPNKDIIYAFATDQQKNDECSKNYCCPTL